MQAGVGEHGVALCKLMNGGGSELIGLRHGTGDIVGSGQIAAGEIRLVRLTARLRHGCGDAVFEFGRGVIGEGVTEILHDVEAIAAAHYAHADDVVRRR